MIIDYRDMASDAVRVDAFRRGIEAVVKRGDVVVDAGCGLGTYAIFACRAGARKVYAIERTDIILTAKQIAKDNGCADRIEFVRGDALAVELPEKADVVITEGFSATFLEGDVERLTARLRRLLKSGGKFVPSSVSVYAAPVSCPSISSWRPGCVLARKTYSLSRNGSGMLGPTSASTLSSTAMVSRRLTSSWYRPCQRNVLEPARTSSPVRSIRGLSRSGLRKPSGQSSPTTPTRRTSPKKLAA